MKNNLKIIALAMLLAPVLAACGNNNPGYKETRTEEEIVEELAASSLSEIGVGFAKFSSEGVPFGKTELTREVNQKVWEGDLVGLDYTLSYTVTKQEDYAKDFLTLTFEGGVPALEASMVTALDVKNYEQARTLGGAVYTLKAEITFKGYGEGFKAPSGLKITDDFVGQKIDQKTWNALVKVTQSGTIASVKTAKSKDLVLTYGRVTGAFSWTKNDLYSGLWITDGQDGLMLYAGNLTEVFFDDEGALKIHVGDVIQVFGEASPYNGLFEVKPKTIEVVTDQEVIDSIRPNYYPTVTGAQLNAMTVVDTGNIVKVSGLRLGSVDGTKTVDFSKLTAGSHWTLPCNDGTSDVTVYVNYHIGNEAQNQIKSFLSALTAGQTFSLTAAVSSYNAIQLSPMCIGAASAVNSFVLDA